MFRNQEAILDVRIMIENIAVICINHLESHYKRPNENGKITKVLIQNSCSEP